MQRNIFSFIFLLISVVLPLQSLALQYSFKYTYEGQTVKYVINDDRTTCKTVDCYSERAHDINGKLILPSHPKDKDGREYILTAIGRESFYDNDKLTSVEIPNTVTTIGHYAFEDCDQLSQVKLPDTLESIGSCSFNSCISLTSIYIPESVENIYHGAFRSCTNLSTINLPDKLTKIWFGTFEECSSLTSIVIPNSVKEIEYNAFKNCSGLKTVIIGTSVSTVGKDAFEGSHPVKFAYPNTLSENPFGYFGSTETTLGAYNPNGAIFENGWIYGPDKKEIRLAPYDLAGDYVIPDTIKSIGTSAFANCMRITSITIPNSLQVIDDFAFYNCIGIDSCSLVIPRSVYLIGKRAFYKCSFINIIVGRTPSDGGYVINRLSFSGCQYKKYAYSYGLENPFIPGIELEYGSYDSDGAIIENGWIFGPDKKEIRYAPYELEGEYVIPETVTSIGDNAFSKCYKLTKVIGTDSITRVGKWAFYASGITSIELPSVKYIGRGAFYSCSVKSVSLGWGITDILKNTFAESGLTYLDIPNSVTQIGESAFAKCRNLTSILIPNSVTTIGKSAFDDSGLKSVVIPNSITQLSGEGFDDCKDLSEIVIGNSMENIFFRTATIPNLYITATKAPSLQNVVPSDYRWNWEKLYIPENSASSYQGRYSWGIFKEIEFLVEATGLSLNASSIKGHAGDSFQLSAMIEPANVTLPYVFWKSTNPEIAIVDNHGLVTLVKDVLDDNRDSDGINKCKIICETLYANTPIAVAYIGESDIPQPQSIDWVQDFNDITVGDSFELSATATSGLPVEYTSSDTSLATIENGIVTFLSPGTVTLSARQAGNEKYLPAQSIDISVDIKPVSVKELYLDHSEWNCKVGDSFILTATVLPENATDKSLSWTSSDPDVATVDENGNVTAVNVGECIVTVTAADGSDVSVSCTVTVSPRLVESIELDYYKWNGFPGEYLAISATISPDNVTDKTVIWNSSDPEVAAVDETGLVIAVRPGSALITATTSNGLSATCEVTVLPILVEFIMLNPSEIQGVIGESFTIEATILPENASEPKIEWKSTNPTVATVSQVGYVEILKEGSCRIIAYATDSSDVSAECIITGNSEIESIFADRTDHISVYTPGGLLVKKDCSSDDLKNLVPGIYIITTETKTINVILR